MLPVPPGDEKLSRAEQRQREARAVVEFLVRTVGDIGAETWGGQSIAYRDVAVLCRTHQTLEAYEDALQEAGIPHRLVGGRRYAQRQEIAELRALLRAIESPSDATALVATLRSSVFGFSDEELTVFMSAGGRLDYLHTPSAPLTHGGAERFADAFATLRQWHQRRTQLSPAALLTELYAHTPVLPLFASQKHGGQRVANLLKLIETARALVEQDLTTLAAFNRFLEFQNAATQVSDAPFLEEYESAVRLLTIHQAKGLEFPVVILADATYNQRHPGRVGIIERLGGRLELRVGSRGLTWTTLGWQKAEAQEHEREIAEERRLWYVAATRVRDHLIIPVVLLGEGKAKASAHWAVTEELSSRLSSPEMSVEHGSEGAEQTPGVFVYRLPPSALQAADSSIATPMSLPRIRYEDTAARTYHEWERAKRATLEAGGQTPIIRTVTELTTQKQALAWPAEAQARRRGGDRLAGLRFGRAVHTALRSANRQRSAMPRIVGELGEWSPDEQVEIAQLVAETLTSPVMARAQRATTRFAETPFSLSLSGRLLEGVIDFAFIENEAWTIVDFKTDRVAASEEKAPAAYRAQLWLYALALELVTRRPVAELVLLFVRSQQIVTFPWGEQERRTAERMILMEPTAPEMNG